ncbi:dGTP triphosphohydrolase, partial [Photobacterium sp. OFAV2-7]|uniref:dGTP triphosphohydrolase n=1 Tax=Photobacterium sp. OFAV2-7 TaxID=2917748 RepID=UPI001EF46F27
KHIFEEYDQHNTLERSVPSLLAALGLAHDLGNPPFGHQGESAIQAWFKKKQETVFGKELDSIYYQDFLNFDGNSQTIRLLTRLQILNDKFGIDLTYATLAGLIKYPQSSALVTSTKQQAKEWEEKNPTVDKSENPHKVKWKKHGFFKSEEDIIKDVWKETGLQEGVRHPLTYVMEACDDIAYSILDAEDIVKKGLASFYDLMNHLKIYASSEDDAKADPEILNVVEQVETKNNQYVKAKLSPSELSEISMQMFRVYTMRALVSGAVNAFATNKNMIMDADKQPKDLMSLSSGHHLCEALRSFDKKWGYQNKSVLKLELEGFNYIHELMDMLWLGIHGKLNDQSDKHSSETPFGKYAYEKISENYRRVFEDEENTLPVAYKEAQLLTDAISGMTDSYLIALHSELKLLYRDEHTST